MTRLLDLYLFDGQKSTKDFENIEFWLSLLLQEDPRAIGHLYKRIMVPVLHMTRPHKLNRECVEELINDSIVIFLQKLKSGQFSYQNIDPIHYILEIAKRNMNNYIRRSIKFSSAELTDDMDLAEDTPRNLEEECNALEKLLKMLGPNCEKLIRLKYLEELKDADIITRGLTQYSTVDALKNHRARCFKKLLELARNR